jgi:hypothetical protein
MLLASRPILAAWHAASIPVGILLHQFFPHYHYRGSGCLCCLQLVKAVLAKAMFAVC